MFTHLVSDNVSYIQMLETADTQGCHGNVIFLTDFAGVSSTNAATNWMLVGME